MNENYLLFFFLFSILQVSVRNTPTEKQEKQSTYKLFQVLSASLPDTVSTPKCQSSRHPRSSPNFKQVNEEKTNTHQRRKKYFKRLLYAKN